MAKIEAKRDRLSIDVLSEVHRKIKAYAALHGKTISEYVLETITERLCREGEKKELLTLTSHINQDPVLKELWDNEKDSAYDKQG